MSSSLLSPCPETRHPVRMVSVLPSLRGLACFCVIGAVLGVTGLTADLFGTPFLSPAGLAAPLSLEELIPAFWVTGLRMGVWLLLSFLCALAGSALALGSRSAGRMALCCLEALHAIPVPAFFLLGIPACLGASLGASSPFRTHALSHELLIGAPVLAACAVPMMGAAIRAHQNLPDALALAARSYRLRAWPSFWRLYVPFSMPAIGYAFSRSLPVCWLGLAFAEFYGTTSGSIASPGLGGFLARAAFHASRADFLTGLLTVMLLVFAFDRLFTRPLRNWAIRFDVRSREAENGVNRLLRKAPVIGGALAGLQSVLHRAGSLPIGPVAQAEPLDAPESSFRKALPTVIAALTGAGGLLLCVTSPLGLPPLPSCLRLLLLGVSELLFLLAPIVVISTFFLPAVVPLRARTERLVSFCRFFVLFPTLLMFPLLPAFAGTGFFLSPLLLFGLPFPIAFHFLKGARHFPQKLVEVARAYRIRGWLKWKTLILPGFADAWLNSVRLAFFWGWNAVLAADFTFWGSDISTHGFIGRDIMTSFMLGHIPIAILGTVVMALLAMACETWLWRPLAHYVQRRTGGRG